MAEIFIDVFFYNKEGEELSDCVAEYDEVNWEIIESRIAKGIEDSGDFPLHIVNKIDIYSEEAGDVIKVYKREELISLLGSGLHKCNSIWR